MAQIDGAGQQDTDNQNAEALQAALAQRQVTLQGQPQGGSDVPIHQNSDPAVRRIGNSTLPSGPYRRPLPENVVYRAETLQGALTVRAAREAPNRPQPEPIARIPDDATRPAARPLMETQALPATPA